MLKENLEYDIIKLLCRKRKLIKSSTDNFIIVLLITFPRKISEDTDLLSSDGGTNTSH